jgi:hypothetical protein
MDDLDCDFGRQEGKFSPNLAYFTPRLFISCMRDQLIRAPFISIRGAFHMNCEGDALILGINLYGCLQF